MLGGGGHRACLPLCQASLDHAVQPLLRIGDGFVHTGGSIPLVHIDNLQAQALGHLLDTPVGAAYAFGRQHIQTGEGNGAALRDLRGAAPPLDIF